MHNELPPPVTLSTAPSDTLAELMHALCRDRSHLLVERNKLLSNVNWHGFDARWAEFNKEIDVLDVRIIDLVNLHTTLNPNSDQIV